MNEQNQYKIEIAQLEADLLANLVAADVATILDNIELIEGLEKTKETSKTIAEK